MCPTVTTAGFDVLSHAMRTIGVPAIEQMPIDWCLSNLGIS
jgi:hypothetical protein